MRRRISLYMRSYPSVHPSVRPSRVVFEHILCASCEHLGPISNLVFVYPTLFFFWILLRYIPFFLGTVRIAAYARAQNSDGCGNRVPESSANNRLAREFHSGRVIFIDIRINLTSQTAVKIRNGQIIISHVFFLNSYSYFVSLKRIERPSPGDDVIKFLSTYTGGKLILILLFF